MRRMSEVAALGCVASSLDENNIEVDEGKTSFGAAKNPLHIKNNILTT